MSRARNPFGNPAPICPRGTVYRNGACRSVSVVAPLGRADARARVFFRGAQQNPGRSCSATPWTARAVTG